MQIHLIRHGRTEANEQRLYYGKTDLSLSTNGRTELVALRDNGIYPTADLYFTSGLSRTLETLRILYGDVDFETVHEMAEYHFGVFEMKSYESLKDLEEYQNWISDASGKVACPSGESRFDFENRVLRGFAKIRGRVADKHVTSTVVICHGGVIATLMEKMMPNVKTFYEWQPKTGRGYTLIFEKEKLLDYKIIGEVSEL